MSEGSGIRAQKSGGRSAKSTFDRVDCLSISPTYAFIQGARSAASPEPPSGPRYWSLSELGTK